MCIAFSASFDAEGAKSRYVGGGENYLLLCSFWLPFQSIRSMQSDQPEVHSRRSSCMRVSRNLFEKPVFKTGFGRQFSKPVLKTGFQKPKAQFHLQFYLRFWFSSCKNRRTIPSSWWFFPVFTQPQDWVKTGKNQFSNQRAFRKSIGSCGKVDVNDTRVS